jgi:putative membrane-bound dehydrogenase-like protein
MLKKSFLFHLLLAFASCRQPVENRSSEAPFLFLPDDLEATLWAESPMVYNPTNMDVDARGRIWITEAVNYRNYNNDSTKALHHREGDRVMILEDSDGDGRADVSKVFVQDKDLVSPLGIAVIGNRVYVSCSPRLIVYTDTDGDDTPDKKEVLLTGFGGVDHDHSLHAVLGGPDGKLYFNTGNAGPHVVTDKSGWTLRSGSVYTGGSPYNTSNKGNMRSDDGKVWVGGLALRVDTAGKHLEVLAHNFRNAYELAVDSRGDLWQNDNDDQVVACRTSWVMEGGNAGYFSSDGTRYWQADQRPWQDVFTAHWHQDDPGVIPAGDNAGAGSPTGVVVNESDALGPAYRGMLFSADAGRNVIFGYHPEKHYSGFDLGRRLNFITSLREDNIGYVWNDSAHNAQPEKWFRPSDVMMGTDGALYIADWYDPVVGGHQMRDTTAYGRIYRIAPKNRRLTAPVLDLTTVQGQLQALRSPAANVRFTALEKLKAHGALIIPEARRILDDENPYHQARAVWLFSQLGPRGIAEVEAMLKQGNEDLRLVAFRALRQRVRDVLPYAEILVADPSSRIKREVIISLKNLPFEKTRKLLLELAESYDGTDRWYLEALGSALEGHESEVYEDLVNRFQGQDRAADRWDHRLASVMWRLHPPQAVEAFKARASAAALSDTDRTQAVTALAFIRTPEAVQAMLELSKNKNELVAEQAKYWITFRQGNDWVALWDWSKSGIDAAYERTLSAMKVKRNRVIDPQMPLNEKKWSARDMAKDPLGVQMLFGLVTEDRLSPELRPYVEELLLENSDATVRVQAAGYFRKEDNRSPFSISSILQFNSSRAAGESVFSQYCAGCHRINNKGNDTGPDLTPIKSKFDKEALLNAILNPSDGIVFGYDAWSIQLADGRSFFGFLIGENEHTVTLRDLAGQRHVIEVKTIRSRKKQEQSVMPSAAALQLTRQQLADLSAYLMSVR